MHDDDALDPGDRKVLDDIDTHGWHMTGVAEDDEGPGFVYSIGLYHSFGHAEVVVVGLELDVMFHIVHAIGVAVRGGATMHEGEARHGMLKGYPCMFRAVGQRRYREYFGYALWFYRSADFPVLQCVWPDKQGRWPWDAEFKPAWKAKQPILD